MERSDNESKIPLKIHVLMWIMNAFTVYLILKDII